MKRRSASELPASADERPEWRRLFWLLLWGAALFWRGTYLTESFTYDEFWSLFNFSGLEWGRILTDLALPNNHPVNTLILKSVSIFTGNYWVMRLPALAAGLAAAVLTGNLLTRWTGDRFAGELAQISALFFLPLVIAGTRCRGYIWQVLFWELTLLGVTGYVQCRRERERHWLLTAALSAVLCSLSVSTGILLLVPAAAAFFFAAPREKIRRPALWLAGAAVAGMLLWYYGSNFAALSSGRSWGVKIDSAGEFFRFLYRVLPPYLPLVSAGLFLTALVKVPLARKLGAAALFPLLAALLTGGGPARVYIYLAPVVCWGAALELAELRRRYPGRRAAAVLTVAALLAPLTYLRWPAADFTPPDYPAAWLARGDKQAIPVVPATAGYPIRCSLPMAAAETAAAAAQPEPETLLLLEAVIRGSDERHCEEAVTLSCAGLPGQGGWRRFRLCRTDSAVSGGDYLVRSRNRRGGFAELAAAGKVLTLDEWLLLPMDGGEFSIWFFRPAADLKAPEDMEFFNIGMPER